MRIESLKGGALSQDDRLDIARLLIKAGYVVYIGRCEGRSSNMSYYVEFTEPNVTIEQEKACRRG